MLSQVERGEANPTFATLWNLTQALGLNLDDLVATEPVVDDAPVEVLDRAATPRLDGDGGAVLWLLAPADRVGDVEWYELCLAPGARLVSRPHTQGTNEHATVLDGAISVTAGDGAVDVELGGTARYAADVPHQIPTPSTSPPECCSSSSDQRPRESRGSTTRSRRPSTRYATPTLEARAPDHVAPGRSGAGRRRWRGPQFLCQQLSRTRRPPRPRCCGH